MEYLLHKAKTRGFANHGWLQSYHTFSFAEYHDSHRMGFGTLRVINDDVIAPGMGFETHSHRNMEIISVPLSGALRHQDSMKNNFAIRQGEIQIMSAGRGISHSEFNDSTQDPVNLLQIWVLPEALNIEPTYSQESFSEHDRINQFQLIVSPNEQDHSLKINQQAYFSLIRLEHGSRASYSSYLSTNGIYFFVINGEIKINKISLLDRDGLGMMPTNDSADCQAQKDSEMLVMEIPMK